MKTKEQILLEMDDIFESAGCACGGDCKCKSKLNEARFKDNKTALQKAETNMKQLADTVNILSKEAGKGRKVHAEDFLEPIEFLKKNIK